MIGWFKALIFSFSKASTKAFAACFSEAFNWLYFLPLNISCNFPCVLESAESMYAPLIALLTSVLSCCVNKAYGARFPWPGTLVLAEAVKHHDRDWETTRNI